MAVFWKWTKCAHHLKEKQTDSVCLGMIKFKFSSKNENFGNSISTTVSFIAFQYLEHFSDEMWGMIMTFYPVSWTMCQIFNSVNQHFPSHQHMLQKYTQVRVSFKVQDTPGNFNKKSTDTDSTLHLTSQKLPLVEF